MEQTTFELYEIDRGSPDLMVASVTGPREQARQEIQQYAFMYRQDGPVEVRERSRRSRVPRP